MGIFLRRNDIHIDTAPDILPILSTGVMNHVDKDSRPDLLKGTNVKVEPGGGRERSGESLRLAWTAHLGGRRGETDQGTSEVWSCRSDRLSSRSPAPSCSVECPPSCRASSSRPGLCHRLLHRHMAVGQTTVRVTGLVYRQR